MECPPGAHLQVAGGPSDESTSMSSSNNEPSLQPTSSTLRQDQPDLSMSYNQLLAHQYHQSHALPPSSHLPPHYHATPLHFAEHPYEGNTAGGSGSSAQEVHTEPLQRILTWQNGMSLATQQPASGASPHYPADAPPPPRPSSTSTASGSKAFASGPNRARALTAPRTISPLPPGSIPAAASSLPPQGINDSTHFQDSLPPLPAAGRLPQAIHFHPPPQATLTLSPSHSALGLQPPPVPPVLPRTIDCNPSLSFTRHASLNFGSEARRSESSSSISPSQSQHQYPNHSFQPHLMHAGSSSASPQPRQIRRAADWDETATPLRTGHARFQSASNVRGAPTEASDGTPGPKFVWNAHGRLATMESIASSQWSPVVNDMYRLVDPLRANFDFTAMLDQPPLSPTKAPLDIPQQTHPSQLGTTLSSFSPVESASMQMPPATNFVPPSATSRQASMQQQPYVYSSSGIQPPIVHSDTLAIQYSQPYLHGIHQPAHTGSQGVFLSEPVPTFREDESEDRRASTSTSISSAPLISPQDPQNDLHPPVAKIMAGLGTTLQLDASSHQYLQGLPQDAYTYRDYFQDPYEPSPLVKTQDLPYILQEGSKAPTEWQSGPRPAGDNVYHLSQVQNPAQWETSVVAVPVAELERHSLRDVTPQLPAQTEKVEIKRKRTPSKQEPALLLPNTGSVGSNSQEGSETLKPAEDRSHRRLSSPVLSMRPSDSGEGDTLSDDDEDDDEVVDNTSADRSQPGGTDIRFGSYTSSNGGWQPNLPASSTSGAAPTYPTPQTLTAPVPDASISASAEAVSTRGHQSAHPVPPPPDTSHLVRAVPYDEDDPEMGRPRRQKLRFANDWYTPEWVRGDAAKKEGFCDLCAPGKWLQLKNSAFWYHRQYTHGISSVSGQPFSNPVAFRHSELDASTEALCHQCDEWVLYTSKKQNSADDSSTRIPTNWFKHAHKCHFYVANRTKNDKPRGKRRKVSSSPDD